MFHLTNQIAFSVSAIVAYLRYCIIEYRFLDLCFRDTPPIGTCLFLRLLPTVYELVTGEVLVCQIIVGNYNLL